MILIVDDDQRLRELLGQYLTTAGLQTLRAANAIEAKTILLCHHIELIVLDVMMSPTNGLELLKDLRKDPTLNFQVPVIFLTADDNLATKLAGFEIGAEDYLTKPFEPAELLARIQNILKRQLTKGTKNSVIKFGPFTFDHVTLQLNRASQSICLTATEALLLKILALNHNHYFSRLELAKKIGFGVAERSIDVQINRLRAKLGTDGIIYLKTIRHVGYSLCY